MRRLLSFALLLFALLAAPGRAATVTSAATTTLTMSLRFRRRA
jgi:hypothetical protein